MKKNIFLIGFLWMGVVGLEAQCYYAANTFKVIGKSGWDGSYRRLPDSLQTVVRTPVWQLGGNSAGIAVRFSSNSTSISVRWESLGNHTMNHMADVGVKGVDLYALEEGVWRFVNCGRPVGKQTETCIIANMKPQEREFMLYLPLYDGTVALEIGVDSLAVIGMPKVDLPVGEKKIVMYGTSILQGACASRPGMAHTNIISRKMNREVINLGFSGNAFLDLEMAAFMAQQDAGVFVLDFVPNASPEQMEECMLPFYEILRKAHPDVPVIFVEDPHFPTAFYDERMAEEVRRKNATLNRLFEELKRKGEKNIFLLHSDDLIGSDREATVDGIHFTDLGMMRYADKVVSVIREIMK